MTQMSGRRRGLSISDWEGSIIVTSKLNSVMHSCLTTLFEEGHVFPVEIKSPEDIMERFPVFRSLRRASDAWEINERVSTNDTDAVNRWKKVENAKEKIVAGSIKKYYAEFNFLAQPF